MSEYACTLLLIALLPKLYSKLSQKRGEIVCLDHRLEKKRKKKPMQIKKYKVHLIYISILRNYY